MGNMFKKGAADKSVEYTGAVTQEDLVRFLKKEGGVHIGLQGTLQHFDELAAKFKSGDKEAVLKEAEEKAATEGADSKTIAEIYVKTMKKIIGKADFVATETKRLEKISADKSVSAEKKLNFKKRLNVLASFV